MHIQMVIIPQCQNNRKKYKLFFYNIISKKYNINGSFNISVQMRKHIYRNNSATSLTKLKTTKIQLCRLLRDKYIGCQVVIFLYDIDDN